MSLRTTSITKMKKFPQSLNKLNQNLQQSLKKYQVKLFKHNQKRDINSPPTKKPSKWASTKTVRSHVSPLTKSNKKGKYSNLLSSSDSSLETFGKISLFENSSDARTSGSPVIKASKFQGGDSIDYETELDLCRKQNLDLQSKIEKLQQRTSNWGKVKNFSILNKESERNQEVSDDKETCLVDRSEVEREFEIAHDQVLRKVQKKHQKELQELEFMLNEKFRRELQENERIHEERINKKIAEISGDYDRKLARAQDEVNWLRRQNEKIKRNMEETNSKIEVIRNVGKNDEITSKGLENDKKFGDLQKQFIGLQQDYIKLKKEGALCTRCKAFTETNSELSSKISRIRSYIDSRN